MSRYFGGLHETDEPSNRANSAPKGPTATLVLCCSMRWNRFSSPPRGRSGGEDGPFAEPQIEGEDRPSPSSAPHGLQGGEALLSGVYRFSRGAVKEGDKGDVAFDALLLCHDD